MGALGDCWDRYWVRMREMMESVRIIRQACARVPSGDFMDKAMVRMYKTPLKPAPGEAYMRCENPRGELGFYLVSEGGTSPVRCRARGPSFCNLSVLDELVVTDTVGFIRDLPKDLARAFRATLEELDEPALVSILVEPRNALTKQYRRLFEMEGVGLTFDPEGLRQLARLAIKRQTGARGLRAILETVMTDIMFDLPSRDDVREVVITPESITIFPDKEQKEQRYVPL